jgi:hypothetical protein
VAYDEALADRLRDQLAALPVTEQKMFGGLAFLLGGHLAVAASREGGLLVRADPDTWERLAQRPGVAPMEMRGRAMTGWLHVEPAKVRTAPQLQRWVDVGVGYAGSLPPKPGR